MVLTGGLGATALGQGKPSVVATGPLTLTAYTEQLDQWTASLERLESHPEEAATLRQQLPPGWFVMADGQSFRVSTDWLRAGLETIEKDPKASAAQSRQLLARLQAMRREAADLAIAPRRTEETARHTLNTILARREFRGVHGPTWFDRLEERIVRGLTAFLARFSGRLGHYAEITRAIFWIFLLLAAGALLGWMAWRLLQGPSTLRLDLPRGETTSSSWQQMAREARDAASRGQYRDAIRLAYWSGIYRLDDLGLWSVDHTRTHREYLRLVSPRQPQWKPLAALTRHFELAWYAARPCSVDELQSVLTQLEELGCVLPSTQATERL
jgi:hypothetical protein